MTDFMLKFSLSISLCSGFLFMLAVIVEKVNQTFALFLGSAILLTSVSWLVYFLMLIWN
jgi:hypothetical protein